MEKKTIIGIGEYKAAINPMTLVTLGLGSCVGVCLRDPRQRVGGMIHIMLPESGGKSVSKPGKYADVGIPLLIAEMKKLGASPSALEAKIAGGAAMFKSDKSTMEVGRRNIDSVKLILKQCGIPILSEECGGSRARSIEYSVETGALMIRKVGGGEKTEILTL